MEFIPVIELVLGGTLIGIIGAMLGIGGGFIIIPFLVLYFKMPMHSAIACSLVSIAAISNTAGMLNIRRRIVNLRFALFIDTAMSAGAVAGAVTAVKIDGGILKTIFSFVLLGVAAIMIYRVFARRKDASVISLVAAPRAFQSKFTDHNERKIYRYSPKNIKTALAGCFGAGTLSGLLGIGGGVILVPLFNIVCGMPIKVSAATSNLVIGVSACAGALVYISKGMLDIAITAPVVLGAIIGSPVGMIISKKMKGRCLQIIFSAVLIFTAVKMFISK